MVFTCLCVCAQVGALERELREVRETCREEPENSGSRLSKSVISSCTPFSSLYLVTRLNGLRGEQPGFSLHLPWAFYLIIRARWRRSFASFSRGVAQTVVAPRSRGSVLLVG